MSLGLRGRQVAALGVAVLLVVAGSTVAHLASVARVAVRGAVEEGELLARQLYHQSSRVIAESPQADPMVIQRDPGIRAMLEGIVGYSHTVVYAAIVDPTDHVLAHSNPKLDGELLPPQESLDEVKAWWTLRIIASLLKEPHVYEAQVPMRLGDTPFGAVRVGVSTSLLRQELARAALSSLLLAIIALGVVLVVGLGAGHMLLRSLKRLARGMERLGRRQAGAVELTRDDELGALAARVDKLGERVHGSQMNGILDSLEDAVIVLNARQQVVFCNEPAEALLGTWSDSAFAETSEPLQALDHPLAPFVAELFQRGVERRNATVKVPFADGKLRDLTVSSYRIPGGDRAGGAVLAVRDLDPVRAVQSLVTYSQKLAALGRLTSGVAHEVKNPLNAMRIHLELLKARLGGTNPAARDNLDVIAHEIQRLDRVVQGFLKFVRPEELNLAPVDVGALLSDVARLMMPEAERVGTRIEVNVAPELPPVSGDAGLLQQACTNLVTNAIQAMPDGGAVTLGAYRGTDGAIAVRVRDEGVGIPADDLERIFRLYYTTKPQGSGIGLSMVYRIVQMHDGRIDVDSEVGRGTVMTMTLPVAPGPPSP